MFGPMSERWFRTPIFRFLVVGGTNTAATAAIVVLLSFVMPGWLAFSIAYALGLAFSVIVTGRWGVQLPFDAAAYRVFHWRVCRDLPRRSWLCIRRFDLERAPVAKWGERSHHRTIEFLCR
jgi:hypothetical protein